MRGALFISAWLVVASSGLARSNPIDVTFTVSGSPGGWVYDFTVTNNLVETNFVYLFGVNLHGPDIVGAPPNFAIAQESNPFLLPNSGGSFDNNWCWEGCATAHISGVFPGQTLSGFTAKDSYSSLPSSAVSWFAYTYNYVGGPSPGPADGCFQCGVNALFVGSAPVFTPVPPALLLFASGLGLLGLAGGWRRKLKVTLSR